MLNPGEIGGVAGGAALLVVGLSGLTIGRRKQRLIRALANADSATRLAALDFVGERGPSAYLNVLVERALVENDPVVRDALVRMVLQADWDPGTDRRLLQLKTWATRSAIDVQREGGQQPPKAIAPEPGLAEFEHPAEPVPDEVGPSLHEDLEDELGVGSVRDTWLDELLSDTRIDAPLDVPVVRSDERRNGARFPNGTGSRGSLSITKAEQAAVDLLRQAGYRVGAATELREPDAVSTNTAMPGGVEPETDDVQLLTELCVRRVVTVTIMEEAIRRMRVENSRLEVLLARFNGPR